MIYLIKKLFDATIITILMVNHKVLVFLQTPAYVR